MNGKKVPEDLISIDSVSKDKENIEYFIDYDLNFEENDLNVDNLNIVERLNNIDVEDGKLNILYKDITEKQFVTGKKVFSENVDLNGPLQLQGKIQSEGLEKMNPVLMINDPLEDLFGDFTLTGNVTIENLLECDDIKNDKFSINRLKKLGLKLDEDVKKPIKFKQQIYVSKDGDRA